jgi:hypothetical protein
MPRKKHKPMAAIETAFDDERTDLESYLLTLEEMSYPDWRERLERAKRELDAGNCITLEEFLKRRRSKGRH